MVITGVLVCLCGGAGAIARFLVDAVVDNGRLTEFPLGTLVVNLVGCVLLGLLVGLGAPHRTMELLGTATLGSYTTFSTWMLEAHRPAQDGDAWLAWANIALGLFAGLAAVELGKAIGAAL